MKVPPTKRVSYVAWWTRRNWPGVAILLALLALGIGLSIYSGHWAMWAWTGVVAMLAAYISAYLAGSGARYHVDGLDVVFIWPELTYLSEGRFREYLRRWWGVRWRDWAERNGWTRGELLDDGTLIVEPAKPHAPIVGPVAGLTWERARESRIDHDYALDLSGSGHELDLLASQAVNGEQSEADDLEWMEAQGIK